MGYFFLGAATIVIVIAAVVFLRIYGKDLIELGRGKLFGK